MGAAVSAAGANALIQVANNVVGSPAVKIGGGVGTAVGVQAITTVMDKVLACNSNQNSSK